MDPVIVIRIFQIIVVLFSVVLHEVMHGVVALRLGDTTAKDAGRLTLNPISHLDLMGSVIVPLVAVLLAGFPFGWAKPVPYNPYNLKNPRKGAALIAGAGPASNFVLAIAFGLILNFVVPFLPFAVSPALIIFFHIIILTNVVLGVFNLVPIPPLDGSKILFFLLGRRALNFQRALSQYGFMLVLLFIFFGFSIIQPVIWWIYQLIAGGGGL